MDVTKYKKNCNDDIQILFRTLKTENQKKANIFRILCRVLPIEF